MKTLKLLSELMNIKPKKLIDEKQNKEYEGIKFTANQQIFRSRLAKKTPNKSGYFVVFWEKDENNQNQAYSYQETPNTVLVFVSDHSNQGVFKFPKEVLLEKGILRDGHKKGKMGIRVYPVWEQNLNKTAEKTQEWQLNYFSTQKSYL